MKTVTIRNLPAEVHQAIRLRAAHHSHSVEAEMRAILAAAAHRPLAAPAEHAATFGLWKDRNVDALDYQRQARAEW